MATQVPYSPVPDVSPQLAPTPTEQVSTPIAAFGGATAQSISHLGETEEGAGNEIFARAYAMQQVNQDAAANEAIANYTTQVGKQYTDFSTQLGKNAVDGYQPFIDGLGTTRQQIRDGLSTPYAQRMFDQESRYMQSRMTILGGSHAAEQNRAYATGSVNARIQAFGNQAISSPDDDDGFKASLDSLPGLVQNKAQLQGLSPEQEANELTNEKSKLYAQRIQGLAKSEPFRAQSLLDQATKDGSMVGPDIARVASYVKNQTYNTGARMEASKIMSGQDLSFGAKSVPIERAQTAIGGYESHNNYNLTGPTTKSGDVALGKYQVMQSNLAPWLKEAGMAPMTPAEFIKNPSAQDQLFKSKFGSYMDQTGSFNEAAKLWFTGTTNPKPGVTDATPTTKGTTVDQYLQGTNAILAKNASLGELTDAGRAKAATIAPDDPLLGDYVSQHIESLYNGQRAIQRSDEFNNSQTIEQALVTGRQGGDIPTTVEDLTQDPKVKQAWDGLQASDQLKYMKVLAANSRGDVAWTDSKLKEYQQLKGMSISQPDEFLSQDVISSDLPTSAKRALVNLQAQVFKSSEADPATSHALSVMKPKLDAAGLSTTQDKDGYNQFIGSMQDELKQFMLDNKRQPKADEVETIGSRLLQAQGAHWYTSGTPFFQAEVPKTAADAIRSDPAWAKMGLTPTDDDIRRIYIRTQYQQLYGKKSQ